MSTSVVFTVFIIAAHEGRNAAVVDIGGAYLNAYMNTGIEVHMRLDKTMSDMMIKLCEDYKKYADNRGCIVVRLDRALYVRVDSAAF